MQPSSVEFARQALITLIFISPFAFWDSLRRHQPRYTPEPASRIPQPLAILILIAVSILLIYWAWPSPDMLGLMAAMYLTIPLEHLVRFVYKKFKMQSVDTR